MIPPVYSPADERYSDGNMSYRRCGRSGILLPEISLGLWHNFGAGDPLSRSREILRYAFDHGITHFDLANNYGPPYGSAEQAFGEIFRTDFRPYRDEMFISTKAGYDMWPGPYGNWGSRKYLMASLDQSLRRMNLDYVDIFYIHRFDPETPIEETLQALVDIVRSGKALYAGISRWPLEATKLAFEYLDRRDTHCLLFQDRLNMLDRSSVYSGILEETQQAGVGFIAFSPLAQGLLTNRYLHGVPSDSRAAQGRFLKADTITPEIIRRTRELNDIAESRRQSLAQMAISWVLADKRVTSVIAGCSSINQLADTICAIKHTDFTQEELALIDNAIG